MTALTLHQYTPEAGEKIVALHAEYYRKHWAFDERFEAQVRQELATFVDEFNGERDCLWWAARGVDFGGAIVVDGSRSGEGKARIRWFIVPEALQGEGVGGVLFDQAMQFCRSKGFDTVYLWTFAGLDTARKLYERYGFVLTETENGDGWGPTITEQKFVLNQETQPE